MQERYVAMLARSKIVVTCSPDCWEGDSRLQEALASGALVLSDALCDPPPGVADQHSVLFYNSTKSLLRTLSWALRNPATADGIATNGQAAVLTSAQATEALVHRILVRFPSLELPVRLHMIPTALETPAIRALSSSMKQSPRIRWLANGDGAAVIMLPVGNLYYGDCSEDPTCLDAMLRNLLTRHRGKAVVAVDFSDPRRLPPSAVLADPKRVHIFFKRSRVDRARGRFAEFPRPVLPLYYPVKPEWANALTAAGAATPRSNRSIDVAVFLQPRASSSGETAHSRPRLGMCPRASTPGTRTATDYRRVPPLARVSK